MTDTPTILCKRCGFANVPGDQFCGSCGAFLEWEGEAAGRCSRARCDPVTGQRSARRVARPGSDAQGAAAADRNPGSG